MTAFQEARRDLRGLTACIERRLLLWLAARTPSWIGPDHLTLLGFAGMVGAGLCYFLGRQQPGWLHAVNLCLALNWLGDSLDGTLARFRNRPRPRYGFYVDHIVDNLGVVLLFGGLALSGYMSKWIVAALAAAYFLVQIDMHLGAYTLGVFKLSYGMFGGTELRILAIMGNLVVLRRSHVHFWGRDVLLYDVAGLLATIGLLIAFTVSAAKNVKRLYELDRRT